MKRKIKIISADIFSSSKTMEEAVNTSLKEIGEGKEVEIFYGFDRDGELQTVVIEYNSYND